MAEGESLRRKTWRALMAATFAVASANLPLCDRVELQGKESLVDRAEADLDATAAKYGAK